MDLSGDSAPELRALEVWLNRRAVLVQLGFCAESKELETWLKHCHDRLKRESSLPSRQDAAWLHEFDRIEQVRSIQHLLHTFRKLCVHLAPSLAAQQYLTLLVKQSSVMMLNRHAPQEQHVPSSSQWLSM